MLNLADLVTFSFPSDAYYYHICGAWYNGSYAMAAKPIRTLELCYLMKIFLILFSIILFFSGDAKSTVLSVLNFEYMLYPALMASLESIHSHDILFKWSL